MVLMVTYDWQILFCFDQLLEDFITEYFDQNPISQVRTARMYKPNVPHCRHITSSWFL